MNGPVGVGVGRDFDLRARVSPETRLAWAKYDRATDEWLPLWCHMEDSAAVALMLWDEWLAPCLRELISETLPNGEIDGRLLVPWLAGIHDIGKLTPAFAFQADRPAEWMRDVGLEMGYKEAMRGARRAAPHGLAGQVLLQEWLEKHVDWPPRLALQISAIIGGHHGTPPSDGQLYELNGDPVPLRYRGASRALWQRLQEELLEACAVEFGVRDRLALWRDVKLPQHAQVLISGLVIVADWIASNRDLFPYCSDEAFVTGDQRVGEAWAALDLPRRWEPQPPAGTVSELFSARFSLPAGAVIRPVQELAVHLARQAPSPGLLMIEAPMGEGKTEAALAVAEIWGARAGAGGVFVALPTMATGNAMFSRVRRWLEALPAREGERWSVHLAHSKAALNDEFSRLRSGAHGGAESSEIYSSIGIDEEIDFGSPGARSRTAPSELIAHQWLSGRKKGMLATFAVGTIDQLLFAGLKARHLVLRHLALAGKVVVIDEAHAFDTYMNTYLDRVLEWLGAYRVPVIVLSATLPARRRQQLAEAYAGAAQDGMGYDVLLREQRYPLLTFAARGESPQVHPAEPSGRRSRVSVARLDDDDELLADRLKEELVDGGCVLVVRNTVNRVIATAKVLREKFGTETVMVAHARFVDADRLAKDAQLLTLFGPPDRAAGERPDRHIVVASQVIEQSLDVDFDLLVTDLAPVDLLLQRIGRLHRHERARPARLSEPRCWITGVDWNATPPAAVRGSEAVYGRHTLLRSMAVVLPHLEADDCPIRLPEDISPLVQRAYASDPVGPAEWAEHLRAAEKAHEDKQRRKRSDAQIFRVGAPAKPGTSLVGWLDAGVGDADDTRVGRGQVRDGTESLEVIVVQQRDDGSLATFDWLDDSRGGLPLPLGAVPTREAAKAAAACALRLPRTLSHPGVIDHVIRELEDRTPRAWQSKDCPWLAGELVLPLDENCQARLAGFVLIYSRDDGLEVIRAD